MLLHIFYTLFPGTFFIRCLFFSKPIFWTPFSWMSFFQKVFSDAFIWDAFYQLPLSGYLLRHPVQCIPICKSVFVCMQIFDMSMLLQTPSCIFHNFLPPFFYILFTLHFFWRLPPRHLFSRCLFVVFPFLDTLYIFKSMYVCVCNQIFDMNMLSQRPCK